MIELAKVSSARKGTPSLPPEEPAAAESSSAGRCSPTSPPTAILVDRKALWSLAAQHASSSWGARGWEFAAFLFLITIFPQTLLPASVFGFVTTGAAILGSGFIGGMVDRSPRLPFVRYCIVVQKFVVAVGYSLFLVLFLVFPETERSTTHPPVVWFLFACICFASCGLNLATIAINVSIERDWVTAIAQGDSDALTLLNTYLRRVDLLSKLLAPLFVSLLTTAASYRFATAFQLCFALLSMVVEFFWINVVYRRLPILATEERDRLATLASLRTAAAQGRSQLPASQNTKVFLAQAGPMLRQTASDWRDFVTSPVFPSSLAISLLYLTVLSFDGTFISWLKSHTYSDAFIAGMRGVGVVTGLFGTVLMPWLERRIGLIRTGIWSILFEVVTLLPVLLSFFVGAANEGRRSPPWNEGMLFAGMALSRIGLWSFDLCQLKELQTILAPHPRRNSITALQYSLQNILDMAKYVLTIILSRPPQFKWAALVSYASVSLAAVSYLAYSRKERGHLIHLGWTERLIRKRN